MLVIYTDYSKVKQALYWEHEPFGYLHTKGGLTIIFACVSLQLEVQIILYALLVTARCKQIIVNPLYACAIYLATNKSSIEHKYPACAYGVLAVSGLY